MDKETLRLRRKEYNRKYREGHKDKARQWEIDNRDKIRGYRKKHIDKRRMYDRIRYETPERKLTLKKSQRKYRETHPDIVAERRKTWREKNPEKTEQSRRNWVVNNPEKAIESRRKRARRYGQKHPEKVAAHNIANRKIRIPQGYICEVCRINPAEEKHHEDYSQPLKVIFVCLGCHNKLTNKLEAPPNGI